MVMAVAVGIGGCSGPALRSGSGDAAPDMVTVGAPVTGTFVAPDVSASIAFPGGAAFLQQTPYTSTYTFYLGTGQSAPSQSGLAQATFTAPARIVSSSFVVSLQVSAPLAPEFPSVSGCGEVRLVGYFPSDTDADCGELTDTGACRQGCARVVTPVGGEPPCEVSPRAIVYQALSNTSQCTVEDGSTLGDWDLSLSSVDSNLGVDAGQSSPGLYLVRGSLTAHLVNRTSTPDGADAGGAASAMGTLRLDF